MGKKEKEIVGGIVIFTIMLPIMAITWMINELELIGWAILILIILAPTSSIILFKYQKRKKRYAYLLNKYKDEALVKKMMNKYIWLDQTEEQLLDSLGSPADIDSKVLKTKTKDTWKYYHQGANRYGLRITVENGIVIGWDKKS